MPRLVINRKKPVSTQELLDRRDGYKVQGYSEWIDPYPHILGTRPEKMVYAFLMQLGIGFQYQTWLHAKIPAVKFDKWYRPDFFIPSLKIVIEVQGFYFHSQPEQIEKDAFKYAVYEMMGYKVLQWWDYEIYRGVYLLFQQDAKLAYYSGKFVGEIITKNKSYIDDSAGISKAASARTDYAKHAPKILTGKQKVKRTGIMSYNNGRFI